MAAVNLQHPGLVREKEGLLLASALPFFLFSPSFRGNSVELCHVFCGVLLPVVSLYGKCMKISWAKWKRCKRTYSMSHDTSGITGSLYIEVTLYFLKRNAGRACTVSSPLVVNSLSEFVDAECNSAVPIALSLLSLQVLFALNQTLLQHEGVRAGSLQGSYTTEDLITHYNCGDLSSIIFNHDTSQVGLQNHSSFPAISAWLACNKLWNNKNSENITSKTTWRP